MRLAFLTSHPIQYQMPLFRRLTAWPGLEFEVLFCSDHGTRPTYDPGFAQLVQYDLPLTEGYRHRFLRNRSPWPSVATVGKVNPEIVGIVGGNSYDAIVVHGYAALTNLLALAAPRRGGTRILMRGDTHLLRYRASWRRAAKQVFLRALFSRVDHFLAVGTLNRRYYEAYGVPPERMTLAPYSIDNAFFEQRSRQARSDPASARRALGLPADRPVFLFCGKLIDEKRPLDLVRALQKARREVVCALAIAGGGPLERQVRDEANRLGVTEDIHFLGFRNQTALPGVYGACDALVLPSGSEAWGLVVNEAMACGLPVVVSDRVGAAPDLVHENGAVYPTGDVAALAAVLTRWSRDGALVSRMGEASRAIIRKWGIDQTAAGILAGAEAARGHQNR